MKISLLLAIRALNIGGAERQFIELVKRIDKRRFSVCIVTLRPGALDHEVQGDPAIEFVCLGKRGPYDLGALRRYISLIDRLKPDVTYSFMFDMNIVSAVCSRLARHRPKLVWGIFGSEPEFSEGPRFLRLLFFLQKRLERLANLITSDSDEGIEFLRKHGFRLAHTEVILSGTDTRRFKRYPGFREEFRRKHGLRPADVAVGICSRLVHMKGYLVLAEAARQLLAEFPNLRFFSVGYGENTIREECIQILGPTASRFIWLGKQQQPENCFSGWDVYCSSSIYGEGFSNSIIEAMACELPCVATDVGDAKAQVGNTGIIVKPGSAGDLYDGLKAMITNPGRECLGATARQRVLERFTAEKMVHDTATVIERLVAGAAVTPEVSMLHP